MTRLRLPKWMVLVLSVVVFLGLVVGWSIFKQMMETGAVATMPLLPEFGGQQNGDQGSDKNVQPEGVDTPLAIETMRKDSYQTEPFVVERELGSSGSYTRQVVSYISDGFKVKGLLLVPTGSIPEGGWPAIVFNHGYIPPEEYVREQKYVAYTAAFARAGYVVFMSDYRGHQDSEGNPEGGYFSPAYTRDVLHGLSAVEQLSYVNKDKIGMWGHSMGGHLTLRSMVVSDNIKVGVIWAGVVPSYQDMRENWTRRRTWQPSEREMTPQRRRFTDMIAIHGEPDDDLPFWQAISPIFHLDNLDGPIQIHHGTNDAEVPVLFSERLDQALATAGKGHELYIYDGADHNLSGSAFSPAIQRSITFFNAVLKP